MATVALVRFKKSKVKRRQKTGQEETQRSYVILNTQPAISVGHRDNRNEREKSTVIILYADSRSVKSNLFGVSDVM